MKTSADKEGETTGKPAAASDQESHSGKLKRFLSFHGVLFLKRELRGRQVQRCLYRVRRDLAIFWRRAGKSEHDFQTTRGG